MIEEIGSLTSTDVTNPQVFAFFKGLNAPATNGVLSTDVVGGLPAGVYKVSQTTPSATEYQCKLTRFEVVHRCLRSIALRIINLFLLESLNMGVWMTLFTSYVEIYQTLSLNQLLRGFFVQTVSDNVDNGNGGNGGNEGGGNDNQGQLISPSSLPQCKPSLLNVSAPASR